MVSYSVHGSLEVHPEVKKLTIDFLNKLTENPALPGLHIEPIKNSIDKRVRTGRVNDKYRAVLFELHDKHDHQFVVVGVYNHYEAIVIVQKVKQSLNTYNDFTRIIIQ